jgi:hypothetical protein
MRHDWCESARCNRTPRSSSNESPSSLTALTRSPVISSVTYLLEGDPAVGWQYSELMRTSSQTFQPETKWVCSSAA